jgi:hypothetical protein
MAVEPSGLSRRTLQPDPVSSTGRRVGITDTGERRIRCPPVAESISPRPAENQCPRPRPVWHDGAMMRCCSPHGDAGLWGPYALKTESSDTCRLGSFTTPRSNPLLSEKSAVFGGGYRAAPGALRTPEPHAKPQRREVYESRTFVRSPNPFAPLRLRANPSRVARPGIPPYCPPLSEKSAIFDARRRTRNPA